jgi:small subunit ribosomal protein S9
MATDQNQYYYALGRRKTAIATVRLFPGKGESTVNTKTFEQYFPTKAEQVKLVRVFEAAELKPSDFHFTAKVMGSGVNGQLEAVRHAIARALVVMNPDLKTMIKRAGFMTRDPRMVERKKPGLRKARRSEQYSKR